MIAKYGIDIFRILLRKNNYFIKCFFKGEIIFSLRFSHPLSDSLFSNIYLAFLPSFLFFFLFFFKVWIYSSHYAICPSLIQVCFFPKTIYLFSIQFILNELSSSHFLTSKILIKISSLKSLMTYHPENRKNIPIVSEFDETFLSHWISRDESNDAVYFVI